MDPREQLELRARLRARVVEEIILTERTYVADLRILCAHFCVPLRDRISSADHAKIFSNLETLVGLHEQLSASLDTQQSLSVEAQTFGAIFLKFADFMRLYSVYCSNMDTSTETARKLVKVPAFAEVTSAAFKSGALRMLSLGDFLIKPVQRITKYPLLLKELIANTEPGQPDLPDVEAAKAKMESLLEKINVEKKANEAIQHNTATLRGIQTQIEDLNINLTDKSRKFVRKGNITRLLENDKQDLTYFLFDDLFLVCKSKGQTKYQLKNSYSFDQCLIRTVKKPSFSSVEKRHTRRFSLSHSHHSTPLHKFADESYIHIPFFPLYYANIRECFELLNLDYKQKVHTFSVLPEDKELIKYMQDAIYAQTLHIEHILKVKYGWFLDAQTDYVADLVFCYRLFCPPLEFLNIFETRYPNVEDGKEILWHFIEGLDSSDLENEVLRYKLEYMVNLVQTQAMQAKMMKDMKRLTRTFLSSPGLENPGGSPGGSYRLTMSHSGNFSGAMRTLSPSPSRRRMSSCAPSPPPISISPLDLDAKTDAPPGTLTHLSSKQDAWAGVRAEAQGITQRECDVFRRVRTIEVLTGEGANLDELLDLMSWTTRWVSTKILSFDSFDKRADAISGFISLASDLKKMNNFNGIMEIAQSLRSAPIERLKDSWLVLPPPVLAEWNSIVELMSSANNYHNYRQALKAIDFNSPCLPCILVVMTDLAAIDLPDWAEGKINMDYVSKVSSILREFRTYQKNCHSISTATIPELYEDLVLKEEDLDKLSLTTCNNELMTMTPRDRNRAGSVSYKTIRKKKTNLQTSIFSRPVAAEFGPADWDRILTVGETKTFQAGEIIMDIDFEAHPFQQYAFYWIKEGSVRATRTKGKMWYDVDAGDGIGLVSLLGIKSNLQIIATTPAVLRSANLPYVQTLLESDPELAARFYKYVAIRINWALRLSMAQMSQKESSLTSSLSSSYDSSPRRSSLLSSSGGSSGLSSSGGVANHSPNLPTSPNLLSPNNSNSPNMNGTPISHGNKSPSFTSSRDREEAQLSDLFDLEEDEILIKSYECKYKRVNGRLFVTKDNLFFYGKSFGVQTKKKIPFDKVVYVKATKVLEVKQNMKTLKFVFKTQEEVNETEALIGSVFKKAAPTGPRATLAKSESKTALETVMSQSDWQLILTGTTNASYSAGATIISEGVRHTRLCQILKGRCVITKKVIKNNIETTERIASRHAGEIFGEMSFLEPGSLASASVVADTDVEICILDFQYITVLLSVYRHLGPSLYKYLALLLQSRLAELEKKENITNNNNVNRNNST